MRITGIAIEQGITAGLDGGRRRRLPLGRGRLPTLLPLFCPKLEGLLSAELEAARGALEAQHGELEAAHGAGRVALARGEVARTGRGSPALAAVGGLLRLGAQAVMWAAAALAAVGFGITSAEA
jgi:hypothetical protein